MFILPVKPVRHKHVYVKLLLFIQLSVLLEIHGWERHGFIGIEQVGPV